MTQIESICDEFHKLIFKSSNSNNDYSFAHTAITAKQSAVF